MDRLPQPRASASNSTESTNAMQMSPSSRALSGSPNVRPPAAVLDQDGALVLTTSHGGLTNMIPIPNDGSMESLSSDDVRLNQALMAANPDPRLGQNVPQNIPAVNLTQQGAGATINSNSTNSFDRFAPQLLGATRYSAIRPFPGPHSGSQQPEEKQDQASPPLSSGLAPAASQKEPLSDECAEMLRDLYTQHEQERSSYSKVVHARNRLNSCKRNHNRDTWRCCGRSSALRTHARNQGCIDALEAQIIADGQICVQQFNKYAQIGDNENEILQRCIENCIDTEQATFSQLLTIAQQLEREKEAIRNGDLVGIKIRNDYSAIRDKITMFRADHFASRDFNGFLNMISEHALSKKQPRNN